MSIPRSSLPQESSAQSVGSGELWRRAAGHGSCRAPRATAVQHRAGLGAWPQDAAPAQVRYHVFLKLFNHILVSMSNLIFLISWYSCYFHHISIQKVFVVGLIFPALSMSIFYIVCSWLQPLCVAAMLLCYMLVNSRSIAHSTGFTVWWHDWFFENYVEVKVVVIM